jgi:hypothetical protein
LDVAAAAAHGAGTPAPTLLEEHVMTTALHPVTTSARGRSSHRRAWACWTATALAFPVAGLPALALGGVDDLPSALLGGAAAGLVVGAAQQWALRTLLGAVPGWALATAAGLALGLGLGSALVDYRTSLAALLVQGLVSGVAVGLAQALALGPRLSTARWSWVAASAALWPLGWAVTTAAGVSVEDGFAVFGATGAIVHSALGGLVLVVLRSRAGTGRR